MINSLKDQERIRKWWENNPEKRREYSRIWREKHPGKAADQCRRWRKIHPEIKKKWNIMNKWQIIMWDSVRRMLRYSDSPKNSRTRMYIGCSPGFLKNHIESLFLPGMTWKNHGEWHIDHIIPLSWFPFNDDPSLLLVASHWTNLRPIWSKENISKGNRERF